MLVDRNIADSVGFIWYFGVRVAKGYTTNFWVVNYTLKRFFAKMWLRSQMDSHLLVQGHLSTVLLEKCRKLPFFDFFLGQIVTVGVMNAQ